VTLADRDVLFCYTDGCVEASNGRGEMLGIEALERELQAAGTRSAADILGNMDEVLRRFRGAHPQDDDATMMIVEVRPEVRPA
jgi:sigma-B regulation protein RsbU (phosphoserine phosphatase)